MIDTIALIIVGLGLMFYGMELISAETKKLTGRQLRILLREWTSNRLVGIVFGIISGAITHSGSSASIIITNLVRSRMITIRNALPILAATNVGTVAIVFLVALNMKLAIMYLLGVSALLCTMNKRTSKMIFIRIMFGIGLMLFGFHELEVGAEHIIETESAKLWLASIQDNYLLGFILLLSGFSLRLLTQSSSTVAILAISLGHAGIINASQVMLIVTAAPIGAGIAMTYESRHEKGSIKQIPVFQIFYELVGSIVFLILLIIEFVADIPLVRAPLMSISGHVMELAALTLLTIRLIPFFITLIFNKKICKALEKAFPAIKEEILASPQYIHDHALEDSETALELVNKEVFRVLDRMPMYIENIRVEHECSERYSNETLHSATVKLCKDIDMFIKDMFNSNLTHQTSESLLKIKNELAITILLEENIHNLVKEVLENPLEDELLTLRNNIVESLHMVMMTTIDSISGKGISMKELSQMTSDKGGLMEKLRNKYLSDYEDPSGNNRKTMMYLTDLYQRIIWLINKRSLSE